MTQTITTPVAASPRAARSRHVYEADVVRVLTFACVIAVHTISQTEPDGSTASNGAQMVLHFTREAFFVLTGFVLVHQTLGRPLRVPSFWRKRLIAVGVPYVAWSLIYSVIQLADNPTYRTWPGRLHHVADNLMFGTAWFHLYFLLVSMQIYLLFPLIEKLVRATARHHVALLAVSGAIQLAVLTYLMYFPPQHGWIIHLTAHQDALIFSYQFYVLLGAVAAYHLDRLRDIARGHRRGITAAIAVSAVGVEAWYLVAANTGTTPLRAASVLQPVMMFWSVAAVAGLFLLGTAYADRRHAGSTSDRALGVASDRSFGVFLVHPLTLWLLLEGRERWLPGLHGLLLTVLAYVLVVAGALAATELFRRSPVSLALTGRPLLHRKKSVTAGSEAAAVLRKEDDHARDDTHPSQPREQAPLGGTHDGDRHRVADPLLL